MKILMLVNWKVEKCTTAPKDKQPPDYYQIGKPYWFFRYWQQQPQVDVIDVSSFAWLERFEKNKLRFYVWQTLRILPSLYKYDVVLSHGMQSGIVLAFLRRFLRTKAKHIVFDIGSFNSAKETGKVVKFMQFSSKSIDGIIYHTSKQKEFYANVYPWLVEKSQFILFGTDCEFFTQQKFEDKNTSSHEYILCVGSIKRDWETLLAAYKMLNTNVALWLLGNSDIKCDDSRVRIIPPVSVTEMQKMISNALFCVLPLEYANYSFGQMTLLQQMVMGKAVVTAAVPSVKDYVEDGVTALTYLPKDSKDLSKKIELLLSDTTMRVQIESNACESVKQFYNEKIMAVNIYKAVNSIISLKKKEK